jgi:hypothetical protein
LRVLQQRVGQLADLVAEGGREQQALLVAGTRASTFLTSWMKPMSSMRSASSSTRICTWTGPGALLLQVEQAAGRGHQDVHAALDAVDLRVHAHAAEHHGGVQRQVLAVGRARLFDLGGEFAGGGQDQGADALAAKLVLGACACSGGAASAG